MIFTAIHDTMSPKSGWGWIEPIIILIFIVGYVFMQVTGRPIEGEYTQVVIMVTSYLIGKNAQKTKVDLDKEDQEDQSYE